MGPRYQSAVRLRRPLRRSRGLPRGSSAPHDHLRPRHRLRLPGRDDAPLPGGPGGAADVEPRRACPARQQRRPPRRDCRLHRAGRRGQVHAGGRAGTARSCRGVGRRALTDTREWRDPRRSRLRRGSSVRRQCERRRRAARDELDKNPRAPRASIFQRRRASGSDLCRRSATVGRHRVSRLDAARGGHGARRAGVPACAGRSRCARPAVRRSRRRGARDRAWRLSFPRALDEWRALAGAVAGHFDPAAVPTANGHRRGYRAAGEQA